MYSMFQVTSKLLNIMPEHLFFLFVLCFVYLIPAIYSVHFLTMFQMLKTPPCMPYLKRS